MIKFSRFLLRNKNAFLKTNIKLFSSQITDSIKWDDNIIDINNTNNIKSQNPIGLNNMQSPMSIGECTKLILNSETPDDVKNSYQNFISTYGKPDLMLYTCLIKTLFLLGDIENGFKYYKECIITFEPDEIFYQQIIEPLSRNLCEEETKIIYEDCLDKKIYSTKLMCFYIFTLEDPQKIYDHIHFMRRNFNVLPNFLCYSIIINKSSVENALLVRRCIDECEKMEINPLFGSLHHFCKVITTYKDGIPLREKFNRCSILLYVFDFMYRRDYKITPSTYSVIIFYCGECGWLRDGERVFQLMLKKNIKPNIEIATCLISGYAKKKQLNEAMKIYNELKSYSLQPNVLTYSVLINGCARAGNDELAEKLIKDMKEYHYEISQSIYSSLIYLYGRIDQPEKAIDTFNQLSKLNDVNPRGYSAIIFACIHNNLFTKAIEYMKREIRDGTPIRTESILYYIENALKFGTDEDIQQLINFTNENYIKLGDESIKKYVFGLSQKNDKIIIKKMFKILNDNHIIVGHDNNYF